MSENFYLHERLIEKDIFLSLLIFRSINLILGSNISYIPDSKESLEKHEETKHKAHKASICGLNCIVDDILPKTAEKVILHNVKGRYCFFSFDPRKILT